MAFIQCKKKGAGGGGAASELEYFEDIYTNMPIIDFLNDSRFTCSDNGYPWTQQNIFQYDGVNMWSPPPVPDDVTGRETIVNNTDKPIFFKVAYAASSENGCDWLNVIVNGYYIVYQVSGYNPDVSGITGVVCIPAGATMYLEYRKDRSATRGLDRVGVILYEVGGV